MQSTPGFGIPFLAPLDPPDIAQVTKGIAETVEAVLARMDKPPQIQRLTANGTYNKPAGAKAVWVRVQGGGAGGGRAVGAVAPGAAAGAGGGAGGYVESIYAASSLPESVVVTVGAGGAGSAGSGGGAGGTSSFGSLMTAGGGVGGGDMASSTTHGSAVGGAGGTATGGNIANIPGAAGHHGKTISGQYTLTNRGGSSPLGTGGPSAGSTTLNGFDGEGYGSGGGGAIASTTTRNGGRGAGGVVIIVTFF